MSTPPILKSKSKLRSSSLSRPPSFRMVQCPEHGAVTVGGQEHADCEVGMEAREQRALLLRSIETMTQFSHHEEE